MQKTMLLPDGSVILFNEELGGYQRFIYVHTADENKLNSYWKLLEELSEIEFMEKFLYA